MTIRPLGAERMTNVKRSEAEIQKEVCKYLKAYGYIFGRVNSTGSYRHNIKKYIPVPYGFNGFADLIVFGISRTIFLEIKSTIGKQTPEQKLFQKMCESTLAKREYYVIRSIEDLEKIGL